MNELIKLVDEATNLMEQDTRGVQVVCYALALTGLTLAVRKVRPFSRFKKPNDIPDHFIKEKRPLTGIVDGIDPSGPLLVVKHKPLLPIIPGTPNGSLPVKVSGVRVTGLGINWLQSIANGKEIKFIPISKEKNCVECEVLLPYATVNKKHEPHTEILDLGPTLVKIGFGEIHNAEQVALRKQLGLKYYVKPTKLIVEAMARKFNSLVTRPTKKAAVKFPTMVGRKGDQMKNGFFHIIFTTISHQKRIVYEVKQAPSKAKPFKRSH